MMTPTVLRHCAEKISNLSDPSDEQKIFDVLNEASVDSMSGRRAATLILKHLGMPLTPEHIKAMAFIVDVVSMSGDIVSDEDILEAVAVKKTPPLPGGPDSDVNTMI
jgi:hypothetical protein